MTAPQILAWLLALAPIRDGNGHDIPRPRAAAATIADVAVETDEPQMFAALLDVLAAKESGYRTNAAGDCPGMRPGDPKCTRALGAKSCGAFQSPCAITPVDGAGQARLAVSLLRRSFAACPEYPLSVYGTGRCQHWGDERLALVRAALLVPVPPEAP
jgi:hypothetical protein